MSSWQKYKTVEKLYHDMCDERNKNEELVHQAKNSVFVKYMWLLYMYMYMY